MKKSTILIGIAGPSGSGKSLLANTIVKELGSNQVAVISEDCYYKDHSNLSLEKRAKINFDHPDAFDHDLLISHLKQIQQGKTITLPQYDHSTHARKPNGKQIGQHSIIVLEGILLFSEQKLRDLMNMKIFVDTPLDVCFIRRLERDLKERQRTVECIIEQYNTTVRPMYIQFIEPSKRYADVIVPHGGKNRIAIDLIKATLHQLLNHS